MENPRKQEAPSTLGLCLDCLGFRGELVEGLCADCHAWRKRENVVIEVAGSRYAEENSRS